MTRIVALLKDVYRPRYVALNIAAFAVYYFIAMALIRMNNTIAILYAPYARPLFYAVMATGSIMFTLAVYSIRNTRKNSAKYASSAAGTVTAVTSSLFIGCGCQAPATLGLFSIFVGSASALGADVFIADHEALLLLLLLFINVVLLSYYMLRLSKPQCRIKKKG